MLKRRLDDRIRELCTKVRCDTMDGEGRSTEVEATLQELLTAIHEKVQRLRALAAQKLLTTTTSGQKDSQTERRADQA